ncbi:MAG TPA: hypothetical protein VI540_03750 [Gaiellaceae bacterium]|nr:hypothetical protein [Gaiellaceae bacterium]
MKFGAVTFGCLVVSMTLAMYGHRPVLMLAVALASAVVFVRHGDGRTHSWTPAAVEESEPRREPAERLGTLRAR